MGMFAFQRLREQEAASTEVASFLVEEPATVEVAPEEITEPVNGNRPSTQQSAEAQRTPT
jgi:hypothetical protein